MPHYDYFVIGAGSGGVRSARIAASHGAKVGIAEKAPLGGTCVNLGCVPKKLMAYAADFHMSFEDAKGYGWDSTVPAFDWNTLIAHKDKEILRLNGAYENTLTNAGVEIIRGAARFVDAKTIDIEGQHVTADNILIAVGGTPHRLDIPGGEMMATSDEFFHWTKPPQKAVVVGGGYIAVEFAHILHGLGVDVTLLYRGELFLRGFDSDLRTHLAQEMIKSGINVVFNCNPTSVERAGDEFVINTNTGESFTCDLPLCCTGRVPNISSLGLDKAGIHLDAGGFIAVNEDKQTNIDHIYAVGDVTNFPALTPVAIADGHALADRLFNQQLDRRVSYNNIATVVFSQPPIGTIGLSEDDARAQGIEIKVYKSSFRPMKHTLANRDERTLMKLIVETQTDKVIGCHMIGLDAPEIMQGFAVAMNMGATKADFDRTMAIHPTSAEEFVTMR